MKSWQNLRCWVGLLVVPAMTAIAWAWVPTGGVLPQLPSNGSVYAPSRLAFEVTAPSTPADVPPWTTNTQFVDLNQDGRMDVLVCDARRNRVICFEGQAEKGWKEMVLAEELAAPAHATVVDLDGDQRLDVVVSLLGSIWPDDMRIGKLVWLKNLGDRFERRDILSDVRRVADAQPGDFDGDGDLDIAVAIFGYARGEVLWLENNGQQLFTPHTLMIAPGAIHVPVGDFDGDGDLDITAVISQDREQVWGFENLGARRFASHLLFESLNNDLGSAGLVKVDLDQDGDLDLLLPVGDNLEDVHSYPQPYHGCYWLENQGGWTFASRRIASLGGTYAAAAGDLDGDKDLDVVLVSMFNDWDHPGHASVVWLENDGRQNFTPWQLATSPTHLVTVDCADINGDGRDDIVAGALHLTAPFESAAPATLWLSSKDGASR